MKCPPHNKALDHNDKNCLTYEPERGSPHASYPGSTTQCKSDKDPDLAFMLEVLVGILGILGTGWIYTGNARVGILLLVIWLPTLTLIRATLVGAALTMGLVGVLAILPIVMTVGIGFPVFSGFRVRRRVQYLHSLSQIPKSI